MTISRLEERLAIAKQFNEVDARVEAAEDALKAAKDRRLVVRAEVVKGAADDICAFGTYSVDQCALTGLPLFYGDRVYDFDGTYILAEAVTLPMPASVDPIVLKRDEDEDVAEDGEESGE